MDLKNIWKIGIRLNMNKSITFGFYKGLGDFISDSFIIEHFYNENYRITIILSSWLIDIAKYIFPNANIVGYKDGKELFNMRYTDDYVFLSPNYLHPINVNYKSIPLYLIKYRAVIKNKDKETVVIKPKYSDLFFYYFNLKKTFLNKHFYYMSYDLLKNFFPDIPDYKAKIENGKHSKSEKVEIDKIFIFPFSGFKPKDYPVENYYNIAIDLKKRGFSNITFFVVPQDKEKLKKIKNDFKVESKNLVELAKMFDNKSLVICSDSGPGHLAAKFGTNALILYSTTNPEKYKPIGNGKIIALKAKNYDIKNIAEEEILNNIVSNFSVGGFL